MSKAFTKDDDGSAQLLVVPRAPLPPGVLNYVTARGLRLLLHEQTALERERSRLPDGPDRPARLQALAQRIANVQARIASAELVDGESQPRDAVRFGAYVSVSAVSGKRAEYRIVGVDEADAASGRVAFSSPLARALLGKRVGEVAELRTPRGVEEFEVLDIAYPADDADLPGPAK